MHRFKDLEIWKRSREFCTSIYEITSKFPDSEKFGLTNQLRRASVSIPSNISELNETVKMTSRFRSTLN